MTESNTLFSEKRILKENYRNYDIVARFWQGELRGVVWKNKKRIVDITDTSFDDIVQKLRNKVDILVADRVARRGNLEPTDDQIMDAIHEMFPSLTPIQRRFLRHHLNYPGYVAPAKLLMKRCGLTSFTELLLEYVQVNQKISDEIGTQHTPATPAESHPYSLLTPFEFTKDSDGEKVLTLNPLIAEGLKREFSDE